MKLRLAHIEACAMNSPEARPPVFAEDVERLGQIGLSGASST